MLLHQSYSAVLVQKYGRCWRDGAPIAPPAERPICYLVHCRLAVFATACGNADYPDLLPATVVAELRRTLDASRGIADHSWRDDQNRRLA